ncbi:MAG TPA: hypothetical protein VLX92_00175 [Kofleriaceae bacterium]|nr:hypothetical protein [Kofleriaceae bacterium]
MKVPAVLVFTLVGASCESGSGGPRDARMADAEICEITCIQDNAAQDGCGCPDSNNDCPTGCRLCSALCIPIQSDGGIAQCPQCAAADNTCPTGCRPEG